MPRGLNFNPRFAEAYCNLGNGYFGLGRFAEAVAALKVALAIRAGLC